MADAMKLLPCPFCGENPSDVIQNGYIENREEGGYFKFVWCENCDAKSAERKTEAEAAEAWNRRAAPPAREEAPAEGAGEREQVVKYLDELIAHIVAIGPDKPDVNVPMCRRVWREVFADLIAALRNRTSEPEAREGEAAKPAPFNLGGIGHSMFAAFHAFRDEYVMSTEGLDYTPSEFERSLIEDFFCGLMSEEAFFGPIRLLYETHPAPATADKLKVAKEALIRARGHTQLTHVYAGIDQALAALNEQPQ